MQEFADKEYLENKILKLSEIIQFSCKANQIQITYNKGGISAQEFGRMGYILFTLCRLAEYPFSKVKKQDIFQILNNIFNKKIDNIDPLFYFYALLTMKKIGEPYEKILLKILAIEDYNFIFRTPVTMYIFMRVFNQIIEISKDSYFQSLYNTCLKRFDFLLSSNDKNLYPFYFSDFIYYKNGVPEYLYKLSCDYVKEQFAKSLDNQVIASSGHAKSLEFFAYNNDFFNFKKGLDFLEKRKYGKFGTFKNFNLLQFEEVYVEYPNLMFVSIDTNAHLINAYLNFYDKLM